MPSSERGKDIKLPISVRAWQTRFAPLGERLTDEGFVRWAQRLDIISRRNLVTAATNEEMDRFGVSERVRDIVNATTPEEDMKSVGMKPIDPTSN